jgi:hypothetical protein
MFIGLRHEAGLEQLGSESPSCGAASTPRERGAGGVDGAGRAQEDPKSRLQLHE